MAGPQRETQSTVTTRWWEPYAGGELAPSDVTPELLYNYLQLRRQVEQMERTLNLPTPEQAYNMSLVGIPVASLSDTERAMTLYNLNQARSQLAEMERQHPNLPLQMAVNPQFHDALRQKAVEHYITTGDNAQFAKDWAVIKKLETEPAPPATTTPSVGTATAATATGQAGYDAKRPWLEPWMDAKTAAAAEAAYLNQTYGVPLPPTAWEQEQMARMRTEWQQADEDRAAKLRQQQFDNLMQAQQLAQSWGQQRAAQAFDAWNKGFGWQVPKSVEYVPGLEPSGVMSQWAGALGVPFNAEAFRNVGYPAPDMGQQPKAPGYDELLNVLKAHIAFNL